MKGTGAEVWKRRALALLGQYKYVLIVAAAGAALLLLPPLWEGGGGREAAAETPAPEAELEERLAHALSQIEGAGEVEVVLTLKSGPQQVLAQDVDTTVDERGTQSALTSVVVSHGGEEEAVVIQQLSPQYQGALVVCSGGDDPQVRLRLVEAVAALTGLGADQISVCKGK